jgi:hypothetical protein
MTEAAVSDRRSLLALIAGLGAAGVSTMSAQATGTKAGFGNGPTPRSPASDFDFLVGSWTVLHRRRRRRLVDERNWDAFGGTFVNWPLLGGYGNVGDNVMNAPSGTFRGIGMRTYDPAARLWSSWWVDGRNPTVIGDPLRGSFADGIGTFLADEVLDGRAVKARVQWSKITSTSALWEQSASADGGASWEVNWTSAFTRQG